MQVTHGMIDSTCIFRCSFFFSVLLYFLLFVPGQLLSTTPCDIGFLLCKATKRQRTFQQGIAFQFPQHQINVKHSFLTVLEFLIGWKNNKRNKNLIGYLVQKPSWCWRCPIRVGYTYMPSHVVDFLHRYYYYVFKGITINSLKLIGNIKKLYPYKSQWDSKKSPSGPKVFGFSGGYSNNALGPFGT